MHAGYGAGRAWAGGIQLLVGDALADDQARRRDQRRRRAQRREAPGPPEGAAAAAGGDPHLGVGRGGGQG
jgi:hypothetical protein